MRSDLTYERLAHGEVDLDLSSDDLLRLQTMAKEDRDFLDRFPPEKLPQRPLPRRPRAISLWGFGGLAATAAVVLILPFLGLPTADNRIKGQGLSLLVYHKTATGTELLAPQTPLGKDDEVQIAYLATKKQYGVIVSVDGRGTVTTHFPLHGTQSAEVEANRPQLLPYSYRLDDAPDFEVLFLVTSDTSFSLTDIKPFVQAFVLEKEVSLLLPNRFQTTSFRIIKKETTR